MSDLTFMERMKLEQLLGMNTGFVLGFTNSSFQIFVANSTGKDIYAPAYNRSTGSKANVLRAFWDAEPNHVVAKLLEDLLGEMTRVNAARRDDDNFKEAERIVKRLKQGGEVFEIGAIEAIEEGREFETLVKSVRDAIEKNEPENGLDRLHTYTVKLLRVLCNKHGVLVDMSKPLHSLMGEYRKKLVEKGLIDSPMTSQILKVTTSLLQAYCDVRDDQTLAHDNPILNYEESLLIYNFVTSAIRFIRAIEAKVDKESGSTRAPEPPPPYDDVPF